MAYNSNFTGAEVEEAIQAVRNAGFHIVSVEQLLNQSTYSVVENPEWLFVILDAEDKLLYGIRRDKTVFMADCSLTRLYGSFPLTYGFYQAALDYMNNTIDTQLEVTPEISTANVIDEDEENE